MTEDEKYIQIMLDNMPEALSEVTIINIMGALLTSFSDDPHAASTLLTITHKMCMQYYAASGAECMCDDCVAHRKANSH